MVEPKPAWLRSSFCSDSACVEVAAMGADVAIRDSKNLDQPYLRVSKAEWNAFIAMITAGERRFQ
jgi:Domain of unknown function (DUF397)